MNRRLFAFGLLAPVFSLSSLLGCVSDDSATSPADASTGCIALNGVVVCPGVDAAGSGCSVSANRLVTCDAGPNDAGFDATIADGSPEASGDDAPSTPFDAGPPPTPSGALLWIDTIDSNEAYFGETVVDPQGNRYFTGQMTGTGTVATGFQATNAFTAKIDSNGVFQWVVNTGGQYGYGMARDPATGTLYATIGFTNPVTVGGTLYTSRGGLDLLVAKLDANGNVVSAVQIGGTGFDQSVSQSFNGGRLALVGYTSGPIDFGGGTLTPSGPDAAFLVVLDSSLNYVYAKEFGGDTDSGFGAQGLNAAVDSSGNAYAVGGFTGQTDFGGGSVAAVSTADGFITSFDSSGTHRWTKTLGATGTGTIAAVSVDPEGNVYAGGDFTGNANLGNGSVAPPGNSCAFVASWTSAGAYRWATPYSSTTSVGIVGVAADLWGEVAVTGAFGGTLTLGTTMYISDNEYNAYVAKLDGAGNFLWSQHWSGAVDVTPGDVGVDGLGQIAVSGSYFSGNMVIAPASDLDGGSTTILDGAASLNYAFLMLTKP